MIEVDTTLRNDIPAAPKCLMPINEALAWIAHCEKLEEAGKPLSAINQRRFYAAALTILCDDADAALNHSKNRFSRQVQRCAERCAKSLKALEKLT